MVPLEFLKGINNVAVLDAVTSIFGVEAVVDQPRMIQPSETPLPSDNNNSYPGDYHCSVKTVSYVDCEENYYA